MIGLEYEYDMENFWGNTVTIKVYKDGRASVTIPTEDITDSSPQQTKGFASEDAAYAWAFNRGYRD